MAQTAENHPQADDLLFIHHSCGNDWLKRGLHEALLTKPYVNRRNDVCYGVDAQPDNGRPDSLRIDGKVPGDRTDMNHWLCWFNDYLGAIKSRSCAPGKVNRIVMFKSCFPLSHLEAAGAEPGDPFNRQRTLTNYKAIFRHPDGPTATYQRNGVTYKPLEQIFAENPDTLFIFVTAPPLHFGPQDATNDDAARRARQFNNWVKTDWLKTYNLSHPDLHNVAVYDWFDVLAYPDSDPKHPNRLREEYGGNAGDAHPNEQADKHSADLFALNKDNFIDQVWARFSAKSNAPTAAPAR